MCDYKMKYAVVCTYSWMYDAVVTLHDTEKDALVYMQRDFVAEMANDIEAEHEFDSYMSEDEHYAKIINYRPWGDTDVTEWRVVKIETGRRREEA